MRHIKIFAEKGEDLKVFLIKLDDLKRIEFFYTVNNIINDYPDYDVYTNEKELSNKEIKWLNKLDVKIL